MTEIKVGDLVRWKSQANASRLLKVGYVALVVQPDEQVNIQACEFDFRGIPWMNSLLIRHNVSFSLVSQPLSKVSYVVSVKTGVTDKAKRTLYHPRQEIVLALPEDEEGVWGWNQSEGKWNYG